MGIINHGRQLVKRRVYSVAVDRSRVHSRIHLTYGVRCDIQIVGRRSAASHGGICCLGIASGLVGQTIRLVLSHQSRLQHQSPVQLMYARRGTMKTRFFALLLCISLLLPMVLVGPTVTPVKAADTLLVPSEYATIQAAIDAAADGDTIVVAAGTYDNVTNAEQFPIRVNKELTLLGAQANVDPRPSHGGRT